MAIDPLKFNYIRYGHLERENKGEETAAEQQQAQGTNQSPEKKAEIPSEQVLEFMAQASYNQAPKVKPLDVSKYVTPEQAERIAGFVRDYQKSLDKTMDAVNGEFPNLDDSAKMALAVDLFNKTNL